MSTRRAPRGRAVGLPRLAPGPSLASGPASGSAADTPRRVSPKSSDNSPPLVRTQALAPDQRWRSEEHTSELQSRVDLVCRLLLEKKKEDEGEERRRVQNIFIYAFEAR